MKTRWISVALMIAFILPNVAFAAESPEILKADYPSAIQTGEDWLRDADSVIGGIADLGDSSDTYLDMVNNPHTIVEPDGEDFIENPEQLLRTDDSDGNTEKEDGSTDTAVKKSWWQRVLEFLETFFPNRGTEEQGKVEATQQEKEITSQAAADFTFDKALITKFNTVTSPIVGNGANEPKFSYNRFLSEDVSAYSGELTLNFEDLVLAGRNGLDLRIGRTYQTVASNVGEKVVMVLPDENGRLRNYLINSRSTYLLDRYNLGMGWGFSFPSVQVETEYSPVEVESTFYYDETAELYYHTGDGGVYQVEFTSDSTDSNLKGYYKKDVQFNRGDTDYSNGQVTSYYSMTLADKTKQYFAKDGRLIGIVDRFGNTIKFEHTMSCITNRVPDGDFKSFNGLWETSSNRISVVNTMGRYDTSSMYFGTTNSGYIMSKPIQVNPMSADGSQKSTYKFEMSVYSPSSTDVKVEFLEFDTLHQLQYTETKWILNTPVNDWLDYSCDYNVSSAGRYVIVKITPDYARGMYIDRVHMDEPKPLISKITDSIGRTITFDYTGNFDEETTVNENRQFASGAVTLTVNAPDAESRILTYTKKIVGFSLSYKETSQTDTRLYWYLQRSETEGADGTPVYYEYGGASGSGYEPLYQNCISKTHSDNDEWVNKPVLRTVRYRDRLKRYEYEVVRKHLGDRGYYDTYRVRNTYDRYATTTGTEGQAAYTGKQSAVSYSYGGTYNGKSYDNETGYPSYTFDEDTRLNEKWTQTKTDTATHTTTISNGAIVQQTDVSDGVTITSDYTNHAVYRTSPTQIKTTVAQGGSSRETYRMYSYNNWGGVATESQEVDSSVKSNSSLLAKYTTEYQYDPTYHFVTQQSYYTNANEAQVTDIYTYDSSGRLIMSKDAMGEKIQYYYENPKYSGILTRTVQDDPMNFHNLIGGDREISYTYDNYGLYATTVAENYDGGTAQTFYQYDYMLGNVLTETLPDGAQTEYEYYSDGKIKYEISPYTQYANGKVFYTYNYYKYFPMYVCDGYGETETPYYTGEQKQSYLVFTDDVNNRLLQAASIRFYDAVGNLKYDMQFGFAENDPNQSFQKNTRYYYDNYDRLEKIVDHEGNTVLCSYDGFSRPLRITDSEGNAYSYSYQDARNSADFSLNSRRILTQKYDTLGHVTERIAYPSSSSTANSLSEKYEYDVSGNVVKYTDPKGQKTTYLYDAANRLIETVLPNGQKATAKYSSFGEPSAEKVFAADGTEKLGRISYRNEKGDLINKFYNFDGRLSIINYYKADAKGRTVYSNEGGISKTFAYDQTDHPITLTSGDAQINRRYGYFGEVLATAPKSGGLVEYQYNLFGMCSRKWQNDYSMDYLYSYLDRVVQSTMPSERTEEYTYTANGNRKTITSDNKTYIYEYYDTGLVKSITYPNGLQTAYQYDNISRITSMTTTKGSSTINTLTYSYDANGNVTSETHNGKTTGYTYDSLDRLTSVKYGDGTSVSYQYDALNNRTKETYSNGDVKTYVYNGKYQLQEVRLNGQTTDTYTYNDKGAVLTHNDMTFTYDEWDNMIGYFGGVSQHTYRYDPNGLRIQKDDKGYIVDINDNVVAETDGSGNITDEILWGQQPLARKTGGVWYYYIYNAHGDVIGLVNENGTVVNSYSYDAWGNIVSQNESIKNPIKYAGEYYDDELQMYYLRARYYDPGMGRFISRDIEEGKISTPFDMNQYVYCRNNPVRFIDPSGKAVNAYGITVSLGIGFAGYEGMYLWVTDDKANFALVAVNGYVTSIGASLGVIGMAFPDMPSVDAIYGYGFSINGSYNGWSAGLTFSGDKGKYAGYVIQGGIGAEANVWAGGDGSYVQPIFSGNLKSIGQWTKSVLNTILPNELKL